MIRPEFYDGFACKGAECEHSCCRSWEIDIDPDTAEYYFGIDGALGEKLATSIEKRDSEYGFRLDKRGRCPFLQDDGLCEIILDLGEDGLCDICALHPRFFFDIGEYELGGLGLSCERVAELLTEGVFSDDRLLFIYDDADGAFDIGQLLDLLFPDTGDHGDLSFTPSPEESRYESILYHFAKTEPIDDDWTRMITYFQSDIPSLTKRCKATLCSYDASLFQRIFDYIFFRQLELIPRMGVEAVAAYAAESSEFVYICSVMTGDVRESVRRFSEQIEYSTDNVKLIVTV